MTTTKQWEARISKLIALETAHEQDLGRRGRHNEALLHNYAASMLQGLLDWHAMSDVQEDDEQPEPPMPVNEIAGLYADQVRNAEPEWKRVM